jgi:dipeptidyl aminopeptidase/acylaminoacyl peptidase
VSDAWIWDLSTRRRTAGPLSHRFKEGQGSTPSAQVAWSPDGRLLATEAGSSVWGSPVTSVVRVWDARSGQPVTPAVSFDTAVFGLAFSPDGRSLLVACGAHGEWERPGEARILDTSTGTARIPPIVTPGVCKAARFSPDGHRLITAGGGLMSGGGGEARVWDVATGRPLTPPLHHTAGVTDAFFSPDGRLAVTLSDALRVWDATTGAPVLPPILSPLPFGYASISPDGRRLLATRGSEAIYATDPGFAQVFDMATGWPLTPPLWRERFVQDAQFSPDGRRIVTTSWVGGALLWDLEPDARPLDDLVRMAGILSGTRVDASGAEVPISTSELQAAYGALLSKDPRAFAASPAQVLGWHHQQALACEKALAWDAALVHLDRPVAAQPGVDALLLRRGIAHASLGHWRESATDLDVRRIERLPDFILW